MNVAWGNGIHLVACIVLVAACERRTAPTASSTTTPATRAATIDAANDAGAHATAPTPEPTAPAPTESPSMFAFRASLFSFVGDTDRAALQSMVGTATSAVNRRTLEFAISDRAIRALAARAFEAAGDAPAAQTLRALRVVLDRRTCDTALDTLTTVAGRARTTQNPAPSTPLDYAIRAAGHAGNACRLLAGLEGSGSANAREACEDAQGVVATRVCALAMQLSPSAQRSGAAAALTLLASSGGGHDETLHQIRAAFDEVAASQRPRQ